MLWGICGAITVSRSSLGFFKSLFIENIVKLAIFCYFLYMAGEIRLDSDPTPPNLVIRGFKDFSYVEQLIRFGVSLKEVKQFLPYRCSNISLVSISPNDLAPCAMYILKDNLERTIKMSRDFQEQGIDIFQLPRDKTQVYYDWGQSRGAVISPPIVEISEDDGNIKVVTDGLHRVFLARELGLKTINVIAISNTAAPLPFLPLSWDEVKITETVPPSHLKRKPRFNSPEEVARWNLQSPRHHERFLQGFENGLVLKLGSLHSSST